AAAPPKLTQGPAGGGNRSRSMAKRSSPPPTKKAQAPGLLGKVANLFRGNIKKGCRGEAHDFETVDLKAYRRRAAEMIETLNRNSDRQHALGVLSVQLAALVEDLESIGADAAVLEP